MSATDARSLLEALTTGGVGWTVGGGWAVDALVGRQTREHADLDLWLPAADLDPLIRVMADRGVDRLLPWGGDRPWNVVLHDGGTTRIDLHCYELRPDGVVSYGSVLGPHLFPAAALDGRGTIDGLIVRCDTAAWSLQCHTGYPAREVDVHDLDLLRGLLA